MKKVFLIIAIITSINSFAQKDEVLAKLEAYNFSGELLAENLKDADADHSFNYKVTTITDTDSKVEEAKFDPTKPIGERWTLELVNGSVPSKKDQKNFDKAHNTKQDDINGEVDDNAWGIYEDNDTYLVISFKYDKATLPKKYDFLGDCKGLAYFNKKTLRLEKAAFINEVPLKIKIFNVSRLDMEVDYQLNEEEQTYFIQKEEIEMDIHLLGELVKIKEINEFSDYKKI
ncbi:MAG: hypothetical protein DRI54_02670 [Bacteroidetes bacterium]|nr:MAG: hypothetical protein DRI54_02670 [Bacteroidota bacterium]